MAKDSTKTEVDESQLVEDDIVTLLDENDNEIRFVHNATVEYQNKWYVVLQPLDYIEDVGDDEVLIFEVDKDKEGEVLFMPIEDDAILDAVYAEFEKMLENDESEEEGHCSCGHEHHAHDCNCGDDCDCTEGKCDCTDDCDCSEGECDCTEDCDCEDGKCDCHKK
ncbi:MAG: DUF1292 domain-containing protein [Clostridia bacterium]|nr:DUF1292 domain-containing protein [Clostridia bacterium]